MAVNSVLFVAIPGAALLLNLFLLLICISAKKNKLIYAFMLLVISFSAWSGGSAGMRAMMYPGVAFWFNVSILGIFFVPFLIFNFLQQYTGRKASFTHMVLGISWLVMAVLSVSGAFIKSPTVLSENGTRSFIYEVSNWALLPFVLGIVTIVLSFSLIYHSIKYQGLLLSTFMPFFLGTGFLFLGLTASLLPAFGSFPFDPLACGINALFLFYALYRKHLITFRMIASRGPMYLSPVIIMTTVMTLVYPSLESGYDQLFPEYLSQKPIVFAVLLSVVTVLVYNIIRKLMFVLFNKSNASREEELRLFSRSINETLDSQQILKTFCDLIERNLDCDMAYILVRDDKGDYQARASTRPVSSDGITIRRDSPLIDWLQKDNLSVSYREFTRTKHYIAMWESEKDTLRRNNIKLILPIAEGGNLLAIALLADQDRSRSFPPNEITFLESAGAIVSIAAKNAMLYAAIQEEAHVDALTGLYNRRYFMELAKKQFEQSIMHAFSIVIISLDDFRAPLKTSNFL